MPDETVRSTSRPVAIDLFSGAGGLSLGFEMAGFDVISAVEYDPVHAATHLYNFPLTDMLCRDVKSISGAALIESARRGWDLHHPDGPAWNGVVDVIVGGPSCQGFSVMGKQDVDDDRNKLVLEFVRLVEEVKPRAFCLENVPGLLDPRFAPLREEALRRLKAAGYSISGDDTVLTATDFGVPQKRRRVVILGALDSDAPAKPTSLTDVTSVVKQALAGLPPLDSYESSGSSDLIVLTDAHRALLKNTSNPYLEAAGITGDGSTRFGHARLVDELTLSGCLVTKHKAESTQRFDSTAQGRTEPVSRAWRLSNDLASRTLRAGTGRERGAFSASRPLHPIDPRVITVREAARLHSFPDWFRFHTTNWHGNRQIGNAVPPLLAAAAAAAVLDNLGIVPAKSVMAPIAMGSEGLLSASPTEAATLLDAAEDQVPKRRVRPSTKATSDILKPVSARV
jgi:DNA (cytosine-5)-methyltransferase 1